MKILRILVACEESGIVTECFRKLGHYAYSCDILPTSGSHPEWHLQQEVIPLLAQDWDLICAFPPCTHLCSSGARSFAEKRADGRQAAGIEFFMRFTDLKCPRVAIENPVGIMSTIWRKPDQILEPFMFGHPETKKTCLWLKGIPKLVPTNIVEPEYIFDKTRNRKYSRIHFMSGGMKPGERAKLRSKTYSGIAEAMAATWGCL